MIHREIAFWIKSLKSELFQNFKYVANVCMQRGIMHDDSSINSVGRVEGYCCQTDRQTDRERARRTDGRRTVTHNPLFFLKKNMRMIKKYSVFDAARKFVFRPVR